MEWEGREESSNVEDRRGIHPGVAIGGGVGIVGLIIALILGTRAERRSVLEEARSVPAPAEPSVPAASA